MRHSLPSMAFLFQNGNYWREMRAVGSGGDGGGGDAGVYISAQTIRECQHSV